jgi:hypothetical protein
LGLPAKKDFAIAEGVTYVSSAYTHPMPIAAAEARRIEHGLPFVRLLDFASGNCPAR